MMSDSESYVDDDSDRGEEEGVAMMSDSETHSETLSLASTQSDDI